MAERFDDTMAGIGTGAKIGGAIGAVTPWAPITSGVGALAGGLIGGIAGYFGSGSAEEKALAKAHARMAATPISAYQSTSAMSTGQQKAMAEGAKQMDVVARGSATQGGSDAGIKYQRGQDISRNLALAKSAAQGATTEALFKSGQETRAAGLKGMGEQVQRQHEYKLAKMGADQKDHFAGIGKKFGESDSAKIKEAASWLTSDADAAEAAALRLAEASQT